MSYQRLSREEAAQRTAERVTLALERIEAAVGALQSGADWRDYLALQARLHSYSANNSLLIAVQHQTAFEHGLVGTPWPRYVAGYKTWRALGRSVDKGQHGYQILAPNRRTQRGATDTQGRWRALPEGEDPYPWEDAATRTVIRGFRVEHTFAYEQTSGAELPEPPTPVLLRGQAPEGLWENVAGQVTDRGYAVRLVPGAADLGGANGRVTWASRLVEVRADMDPAARVKSLIHELAHIVLGHDPNAADGGSPPSRALREVEAESVAFVVADAHHMRTDDYSFPYVSAWAGSDGTKAVQGAASRVAAAAKQVIAASTIVHSTGGRAPGVEQALEQRRTELAAGPSAVRQHPSHAVAARQLDPNTTAPGELGRSA